MVWSTWCAGVAQKRTGVLAYCQKYRQVSLDEGWRKRCHNPKQGSKYFALAAECKHFLIRGSFVCPFNTKTQMEIEARLASIEKLQIKAERSEIYWKIGIFIGGVLGFICIVFGGLFGGTVLRAIIISVLCLFLFVDLKLLSLLRKPVSREDMAQLT